MANDGAQYDIEYIKEALSYREDDMKKALVDLNQLKKEAEIIHGKAKKEAIDKMSEILAETREKETFKKLEKICDSLIITAEVLLIAIYRNSQQEFRDSISTN